MQRRHVSSIGVFPIFFFFILYYQYITTNNVYLQICTTTMTTTVAIVMFLSQPQSQPHQWIPQWGSFFFFQLPNFTTMMCRMVMTTAIPHLKDISYFDFLDGLPPQLAGGISFFLFIYCQHSNVLVVTQTNTSSRILLLLN